MVKDSALFGDAPRDQSAQILIIGRRLEVDSAALRPIEYAVGRHVLQIAETRSLGLILKLRIVGDQLCPGVAGRVCEYGPASRRRSATGYVKRRV